MELNFAEALRDIDRTEVFRIANEARPPASYLFATLLPEQRRTSYSVHTGHMVVRATMAGMVGMDAPYPPGGQVDVSRFLQESAKFAIDVGLPEYALRHLQDMMTRLALGGGNTNAAMAEEALNFFDKVVVQSHLDLMEWLRGQALTTGEIDWTFNKKSLVVDYGLPAGNILTPRTGNDAYGGSTSKFWTDVQAARKQLRYNLVAAIAHPDTIDAIVLNSANALRVIDQDDAGSFTVRQYVGNTEVLNPDERFQLKLIAYSQEGEIIHPTTGLATVVPFMPTGKIIFVGRNSRTGYRVGEGSTDDPQNSLALGYTHIAPTVEGGGAPGRWGRVFTPEERPWELRGQAVTNGLPVIEIPKKLVIAETTL